MLALCPQLASSDDTILWRDMGDWTVRVDHSLGNGCYAYAAYNSGTVFRIGMNPRAGGAYVVLANGDWSSLEEGKEYELTFQFDDEEPWVGYAAGTRFSEDGMTMLWADIDDADFLLEFARKHSFTVAYRGRHIGQFNLRGSALALKELVNCQEAMSNRAPSRSSAGRDPFRAGGSGSNTNDPFR